MAVPRLSLGSVALDPGEDGALLYYETHANCFSDHTAIVLSPGIAYMPKTWTTGERWTQQGVSRTIYSENEVPVCAGTNTWRSRVVGLATLARGEIAVHTQTDERQALVPLAGAPVSAACPAGQTTAFGWQENFYIGAVPVPTSDGSGSGHDAGLIRSTGGNLDAARQAGHPQWDVVFSSWERLPPGDAGTMTTTTATTAIASTSSGNTIAFTYTAPRGGSPPGIGLARHPFGLDGAGHARCGRLYDLDGWRPDDERPDHSCLGADTSAGRAGGDHLRCEERRVMQRR